MTIQIGYDSKTINVSLDSDGLDQIFEPSFNKNQSGSGVYEFLTMYDLERISFSITFTEAIYFDLLAFWSWACRGNVFSLAMDSTQVGNTTLDGAAASAQKNVPLTATAAFSAGEYCIIKQAAVNGQFEIVEIDSVDAGVKIVTVADLKFTYASGDSFRHFKYYPELKLMNERFNPPRRGDYYFWTIEAIATS